VPVFSSRPLWIFVLTHLCFGGQESLKLYPYKVKSIEVCTSRRKHGDDDDNNNNKRSK